MLQCIETISWNFVHINLAVVYFSRVFISSDSHYHLFQVRGGVLEVYSLMMLTSHPRTSASNLLRWVLGIGAYWEGIGSSSYVSTGMWGNLWQFTFIRFSCHPHRAEEPRVCSCCFQNRDICLRVSAFYFHLCCRPRYAETRFNSQFNFLRVI